MPRTKASRNIAATKRARDNASEIDDILRDFEIEQEQALQQIRSMHKQILEDVDTEIENFKQQLPPRILKLTMGELKRLENYDDVNTAIQNTMNDLNMTVKETIQKADEGYITGEASNKSRISSDVESNSGDKGKVSTLPSLKSFKARRRSQSTSNLPAHSTPGPRAMMMKHKTPNVKNAVEPYYPSSATHQSRSKFRTPMLQKNAPRTQRAVSAEPIATITPKINPTAPVAILRHAKPGEVAFSVTGSPVVPSQSTTETPNMNIPFKDGVLMIRAGALDLEMLDTTYVNNAVQTSIDDMRALKNALDMLVGNYEKRQALGKK